MTTGDVPTVLAPGGPNALGRALGLVGDEWAMVILQRALLGEADRYGDFLEQLPISNAVLAARLELLTSEGLLAREVYQQRPPRAAYRLTERGRSVWPVQVTIWDWERHWVTEHPHPVPAMVHTDCSRAFRPRVFCAACQEVVLPSDVKATVGPSGGWDRATPLVAARRRTGRDSGAALFPGTMTLFGSRWSSAMIAAAFLGARRFSDYQEALLAPPSIVADRLRLFTERDILRAMRTNRPGRVEYRLTPRGLGFFPVMLLVQAWAQRWYVAPEGPALVVAHRLCGHTCLPVLHCGACGDRLRGTAVRPEPATAPPARTASGSHSLPL